MDDSKKYIRFEPSDWKLVLVQLLMTGLVLCVFAVFHHVLPEWEVRRNGIGAPSGTVARTASTPAPEESYEAYPEGQELPESESKAESVGPALEQLPTPEPTPDPRSPWQIRFAEHFSESPVWGEKSYSSPNLSVTMTDYIHPEEYPQMCYHVADIYVGDLSCLRAGMPLNASFGSAIDIAVDNHAVAAINGDMTLTHRTGVLVRHGMIYGDIPIYGDLCVLRYDGVMETFLAGEYTAKEIFAEEPYQSWQFGPALLDASGEPREDFNIPSELQGRHPRTAIGYFEPGHYCFVAIDGRLHRYSNGAEMSTLAKIMHDLGCVCAYNLDGGASSMMVFNGDWANTPCSSGAGDSYRYISDMILVGEPEEGETN